MFDDILRNLVDEFVEEFIGKEWLIQLFSLDVEWVDQIMNMKFVMIIVDKMFFEVIQLMRQECVDLLFVVDGEYVF